MKQQNNSPRESEESTLKNLLSLGTGMSLAALHSGTMYYLMERAGMYDFTPGIGYEQLMSPEGVICQLAAATGSMALLFGGMLGMDKLLKLYSK